MSLAQLAWQEPPLTRVTRASSDSRYTSLSRVLLRSLEGEIICTFSATIVSINEKKNAKFESYPIRCALTSLPIKKSNPITCKIDRDTQVIHQDEAKIVLLQPEESTRLELFASGC